MQIRANFDSPVKSKQARVSLEALGAPSLSTSSSSRSSGSTTTVGVGDGKQGGFMNALSGLFGGGAGKASLGASKTWGPSKSGSKSWSFGSGAPEDDGVIHESFEGEHQETLTVTIDDAYADAARAAITGAGGTLL